MTALRNRPHAAHPPLFWEHEGNRAVRERDWKLAAEHGTPWEVCDLAADRSEVHHLAMKWPGKVRELERAYQNWADRVGVQPWPPTKPRS